jgi:hypothetical protein
MNKVTITSGLIVYKEIIPKKYADLLYFVVRERLQKNRQPSYIPVIKFMKYKKSFIKYLLSFEIGDVINVFGELGHITARVSIPELKPPFRDFKKMVIYMKDAEFVEKIDIKSSKIETFINIEDDSLLDGFSQIEVGEFENMFEELLGVKSQ